MFDSTTKVKEMCKLKNMQQKELAQKLGITKVGVSATLRNNNPQLGTMESIADTLGVSLVELLSLDPNAPKTDNTPLQSGTMCCPHCGGKIELFVKAL